MKKAWVLSYPLSAQPRLIRLGRCPGPRLIWVFAGRTFILLVLSWGGLVIFAAINFHVFVIKRHFCCDLFSRITETVKIIEPWHDKSNKMSVRPMKTHISLGIHPVWSESSVCSQWVAEDPSFLHADCKGSDQTGWMPRLIWVFTGRTVTSLVLSCRGSFCNFDMPVKTTNLETGKQVPTQFHG